MIRICTEDDFDVIREIINDAAIAYKGVIPDDRWHQPYMTHGQLRGEIEDGVVFFGCEAEGTLMAVMGIQDRGDVCLIRHAYVRTAERNRGLGTRLLAFLESTTAKPCSSERGPPPDGPLPSMRRTATGSFPGARRTGSSERTGKYPGARQKPPWSSRAPGGSTCEDPRSTCFFPVPAEVPMMLLVCGTPSSFGALRNPLLANLAGQGPAITPVLSTITSCSVTVIDPDPMFHGEHRLLCVISSTCETDVKLWPVWWGDSIFWGGLLCTAYPSPRPGSFLQGCSSGRHPYRRTVPMPRQPISLSARFPAPRP